MDEAGAAIRFLNDHPELNRLGVQVEFDANASQEAADVVIDYQREISTCDGETANTSYIYCSHYLTDRDDLRGDYTINVRGIYTDKVVTAKTVQALLLVVGHENPTSSATVPDPEIRYAHPWGGDRLIVNITYATSVERTYTKNVREAVEYWETNDERYGNYTANWTVQPNASEADLTVTVTDYIHSCDGVEQNGSRILGCGDILNKNHYVKHADIRVVDGLIPTDTTSVLKHEFGHVYGRQHGQEPLPLMREIREESAERLPPHDTGNISYYIDYASYEYTREVVEEQIGHAIDYYESHNEYAPDNLTLNEVESVNEAEIVIRRDESRDPGSNLVRHGRRIELDGGEYRYLNVTIQTKLDGSETLGWHVGYWFGYVFTGADKQDELPPPFQNADSYRERVEWWEEYDTKG